MNPFTVLQNNAEESKRGFGHELLYPKVSFLDPVLTFSVPQSYTSYGVADLIAHCLETFFGQGDAPLSDHTIASIIRLAINTAKLFTMTRPTMTAVETLCGWQPMLLMGHLP